jgi:heme exporter protein B
MKSISSIVFKDVLIELRNKESVGSMLMFGILTIIIFNFSFEPIGDERITLGPGILWTAFIFAGILGLNRSLAAELDNDCIQGLLLAPISRGDLYIGKVVSNLIFMFAAEAMVLPPFVIFNNFPFDIKIFEIAGIAVLGTLGFVAVGTVLSMIAANTRMKEVLLPILLIPITLPVIHAAVQATEMVLRNETTGISYPLSMLVGFGVVYAIASFLMIEYVLEE